MRYLSTVLLAVLLNACPQAPRGKGMVPNHEITGAYSFGTPVRGAGVGLYLDAALTNEFVQTTTREDGHFALSFLAQENDGPFWLCTSRGSFVDPQSAVPISLSDYRACRYLEEPPEQPVALTPNINLAMVLARARGGPLANAFPEAVANFNGFSGCAGDAGLLGVIPIDPTAAAESDLSPGLLAGILLSGVSAQAQQISLQLNYTPGVRITPVTLWRGWEADLSDTILDGRDHAGPIDREGYAFTADSFRGGPLSYVQGVRRFLESDRNTTSVSVADMRPILDCMTSYTGEPLVGSVGSSAGLVDVATPIVNFLTPGEGDVLSSQAPVAILAVDTSAITRLEFSQDQSHITADAAELNGTSAKLRGTVDVAGLANGELELCAEAEDSVGNVGTGCLTVQVDTEAPIFDHLEPSSGSEVRGSVDIKVKSSDRHGLYSLALLSPPSLDVDVEFNTTEAELTATWDTTLAADGDAVVRVQAKDLQGHIADASLSVVIDNFQPGQLSGKISFTGPIVGANIQAFSFTAMEPIGEAGVSGADGTFTVSLPDNYTGWVLLVASGTAAEYRNPLSGRPTRFRYDEKLLAAVFYQPSAAGTVITDLQINALTDLAVTRALSMDDPEGSIRRSYFLFGEHIDVNDPVDLQYTPVSDISSESILDDSEASQRLAVFHVAMARWCGEVAIQEGLALSALDLLSCLRLFERDLGNGVLDGLDANGAQIYATSSDQTPLSANTLRFHAANAGRRWLANIELAPDLPGINSTGLAADSFSTPQGLFWGMSENNSELFGEDAPLSFDQEGPTITEAAFLPAKDPPIYRQGFALRVTAEDPSNIASIRAVVAGADVVGGDQMPGYPDQAYFPIDTTGLADGEQELMVTTIDMVGNSSSISLPFVVDNTPPTVTAGTSSLVAGESTTLSWTVSDAVGPVELLEAFTNDAATPAISIPLPAGSGSSALSITCDATTNWRVEVKDAAGHTSSVSGSVAADCNAPAISLRPSTYFNEQRKATAAGPSSLLVPNGPRVDITAGRPITIHKYRHRYCSGCENMPRLEFAVSDTGAVATPTAELQVQYRYGSEPWRVPAGGSGSYSIELSADNLNASILSTSATTLHAITLRARDSAGNETIQAFTFRLDLMPVPLILSGCGLSSQLTAKKIRSNNFAGAFGIGSRPRIGGQVFWPYTAAPENLRITLAGARTKTRFRKERGVTHTYSGWSWVPGSARCGVPYYEMPGSNECASGSAPAEYDSCPGCGQINDDVADSMAYSVAGAAVDGPNAFRIAPNQVYTIAVSAEGPEVYIGGEMFLWTIAANGRYRLARANGGVEVDDTRRTCIPGDPCRNEKHRRTFRADRYVYEARIDAGALVVTASETAYSETPPVLLWGDCGQGFWYLTNVGGEQSGTF